MRLSQGIGLVWWRGIWVGEVELWSDSGGNEFCRVTRDSKCTTHCTVQDSSPLNSIDIVMRVRFDGPLKTEFTESSTTLSMELIALWVCCGFEIYLLVSISPSQPYESLLTGILGLFYK